MGSHVSLWVFGVRAGAVPSAIARMALDRRQLRRTPGLEFWKLLGTGDGRTFDVRDADLRTWALLGVWESPDNRDGFESASPVLSEWGRLAHERWRVDLRPLAVHGRWSGRQPFEAVPGHTGDGPVAAITRARLRPLRARSFWRAVPPVNAELQAADGLLLSLGIGEAPVGLQGTFSLWRRPADLTAFAYRTRAHGDVITRSRQQRWYAEELFARFAVTASVGTFRGRDPLHPVG